jgi:hypothetical protein
VGSSFRGFIDLYDLAFDISIVMHLIVIWCPVGPTDSHGEDQETWPHGTIPLPRLHTSIGMRSWRWTPDPFVIGHICHGYIWYGYNWHRNRL